MAKYIEAKKVYELYDKHRSHLATYVYEFGEELRKLQTIDRPHGEWIDLSDGWQEGTFRCSSCQMEFVLLEGTPEDNEYNYCPNCGASMLKEGDEK